MSVAEDHARPLHVLVADARSLWREALKVTIEQLDPEITVEEVADLAGLEDRVADNGDIGLVVISLDPDLEDDLRRLETLRRRSPGVPVAVVADLRGVDDILAVMQRGARAFIPTTLDSRIMVEALRLVAAGGIYVPDLIIELMTSNAAAQTSVDRSRKHVGVMLSELSPRQRQVLELIGMGRPNKLIAHELGISENTVKAHLRQIMKRLGVTNRTEAALIALGRGPGADE